MNPRERILAIVVGCMMVAIVGYLGFSYVSGQFAARHNDISRFEADIKRFKQQDLAAKLALQKIAQYEARSLPSNVEIAKSEYTNWLLRQVQAAGMVKPDVSAKLGVSEGDLLVRQTFTVTAKGTLPQVIDLLHAFYSVDWLHRITRLSLQPIKDDKALNVTIDIEALSLRSAREATRLVERPANRLALADRAAYQKIIANRNVFGPPNNAPRITGVSGSKDVYLGRQAELTVKATDPDPLDKVRYRLVETADPAARLDESSGRLTWYPKSPGKYEFVVEAVDDGLPSLPSNREKIVINVTPQPPPQQPRLEFDHAQFTVLTAVIDLDGKGEVWLHNRPAGQTIVLHEGDQFEIGSVKGTVVEIGQYDFSFRSDGKLRRLVNGDILDKAQVIPETASSSSGDARNGNSATTPTAQPGSEKPVSKDDRAG